jgi:ubiquinone/menaquinone biosynthesis C-methylase UbiE
VTVAGDIDFTYDDALARHYDEDYEILRRNAEDIRFYRELARASGGPVLEVACGTGRVLLPIAREGMTVTGVDPSGTMLRALREKLDRETAAVRERVRILEGSFASIPVPPEEAGDGRGPYALVYSAFRAFQHLYTREQKMAALREMKRVLAPAGTLAFDVFDDCPERAAARIEEQSDYRLEDAGQLRERRSSSRLLPEERLTHVLFRWLTDGEETERSEFHMSITTRKEIDGLLEEAGLRLHALHAEFSGAAWSADDPRELVVLARHA